MEHLLMNILSEKSWSASLKEDGENKYGGELTVVFHSWLWESCLVYLTVLSFPDINKENHKPVLLDLSFCIL